MSGYVPTHDSPCPCGAGRVLLGPGDFSHGYGAADPWYRCTCAACDAAYRFHLRRDEAQVIVDDVVIGRLTEAGLRGPR